MTHPIESASDALIARLRQTAESADLVADGQVLLPGMWSSFDAARAEIAGRITAGDAALLRIALAVPRPGRWCTLALALDATPLAEGDVLGVVADLAASAPAEIALELRSLRGRRRHEVVFDDRLALTPEGTVATALLTVPPGGLPGEPASRRLLVLKLPQIDIDIVLRDLRLFVLPAAIPGAAPETAPGSDAAPAE